MVCTEEEGYRAEQIRKFQVGLGVGMHVRLSQCQLAQVCNAARQAG